MTENNLSGIPETMLITLWAKAEETKRSDGIIYDRKALSIRRKIDYDFSKMKKGQASQVGCCIRARLIDKEVMKFIGRHRDAVVIQIGAGIDARYERLRRPEITHWYDLDLKESIAIRRKFLKESERNTYIESSMFDYGWTDTVKSHGKPVLIIIEGVLMYFEPEKVMAFFNELCRRFDKAVVLFDLLGNSLVGKAKHHDTLKNMDKSIEFKWSVLYANEMEEWNEKIRIEKEYYMSKYDNGRFPLILRLLYKIPYFFIRYNQRIVRLRIGKSGQ